jgi:plastocyanin
MKKKNNMMLWIALGIAAVIIIGALYFFAFNQKDSDIRVSEKDNSKILEAEKALPQTYEVMIENSSFKPETLRINAGDTIKWTNQDILRHTVTADDKSFISDYLRLDTSFSHTFDKNGTFFYGCGLHPSSRGKIIVGA